MVFKYIPDRQIYIYIFKIPEHKIYMILNFPDKISMSIPIISAMIFSGDFLPHRHLRMPAFAGVVRRAGSPRFGPSVQGEKVSRANNNSLIYWLVVTGTNGLVWGNDG